MHVVSVVFFSVLLVSQLRGTRVRLIVYLCKLELYELTIAFVFSCFDSVIPQLPVVAKLVLLSINYMLSLLLLCRDINSYILLNPRLIIISLLVLHNVPSILCSVRAASIEDELHW